MFLPHPLRVFLLLSLPLALHGGELKPAALFSDHMVLQRDLPVPVWGHADPADIVTVSFGGQKKSATAGADGAWRVVLDPMAASGAGRVLRIESEKGDGVVTLGDVLVGEVWLCSGQSNMFFQMRGVENSAAEIAAARHPSIRFFRVKEQFAQAPAADVEGVWKPVSPETAAECSAVACYFATALEKQLKVPIGLVVSSVGGTRIETWMRPALLERVGGSEKLLDKWKQVAPDEFARIGAEYRAFQQRRDRKREPGAVVKPEKPPALRCHDCPGALHHGMIAPLQPFAIRGVIWYQGEANSGRPAAYGKLLPAMIADWRSVWGESMPFLFVQLAPYQGTHPAFREAQHRIAKSTPRTAMVVTTDVGDAGNIHPTRKRPVGERLALAARALAYGESLVSSGPVYRGMTVEDGRVIVSFDSTGSGLVAKGGELRGFTVAGSDGRFVPARAVIQGDKVIVSVDAVPQPEAVRFGWAQVPDVNLCNAEGLPAVPFRSDASAE